MLRVNISVERYIEFHNNAIVDVKLDGSLFVKSGDEIVAVFMPESWLCWYKVDSATEMALVMTVKPCGEPGRYTICADWNSTNPE